MIIFRLNGRIRRLPPNDFDSFITDSVMNNWNDRIEIIGYVG